MPWYFPVVEVSIKPYVFSSKQRVDCALYLGKPHVAFKDLAVAYAERTREGPAREHIEKECNTIRATIAHQLRPRIKPPMRPTRRDKLKRMAATIPGTDVRPADLSEAQYRKSRRARVQEAFEERWKREWEKYQSTLTHRTTAQAEPRNKKLL